MQKKRSKIAILTDTGCNVREDLDKNIFVVPLYITNENEAYKDTIEISNKKLYEKMDEISYKTAAPSIEDFLEKISYIKSLGYESILGISLSSNLSGTFNSMRMALERSEITHKIMDSKSASVGSALLVIYGSKLIDDGYELENIYEILEKRKSDIKIYGVVSDLKYLIRGGRISHLKGKLGSMLKINPILRIGKSGEIEKYKSIRGKDKAVKSMISLVKKDLNQVDDYYDYYLALSYAKDPSDIGALKVRLADEISKSRFYLEESLTSVLGCHTGSSISLVAYLIISK